MPDGYGIVFEQINEKLDKITESQGKVEITLAEMKGDLRYTKELTEKHEKIISGKPEDGGKGGLVYNAQENDNRIKGLGRSLDRHKAFETGILTGIFAIIQIIFATVLNRVFKHSG